MALKKECTKCKKLKRKYRDFYICGLRLRSECKECTIKGNVAHQKETQAWRTRYPDDETRRKYMRTYYEKNKEKFAKYRHEFKLRNPAYYREYFKIIKKRREEQLPSPNLNSDN